MIPLERYKVIYRCANKIFPASVTLLASLLNISHMTIGRDIKKLENSEQPKKHGQRRSIDDN